eukprot:6479009-Amphidinium_carterae.1
MSHTAKQLYASPEARGALRPLPCRASRCQEVVARPKGGVTRATKLPAARLRSVTGSLCSCPTDCWEFLRMPAFALLFPLGKTKTRGLFDPTAAAHAQAA